MTYKEALQKLSCDQILSIVEPDDKLEFTYRLSYKKSIGDETDADILLLNLKTMNYEFNQITIDELAIMIATEYDYYDIDSYKALNTAEVEEKIEDYKDFIVEEALSQIPYRLQYYFDEKKYRNDFDLGIENAIDPSSIQGEIVIDDEIFTIVKE